MGEVQYIFRFRGVTSHGERGGGLDHGVILGEVMRTNILSSNKSPTRCNNSSVYCPDLYLQLNVFWAFSRPSSGAR